jgi:hypothetical protein
MRAAVAPRSAATGATPCPETQLDARYCSALLLSPPALLRQWGCCRPSSPPTQTFSSTSCQRWLASGSWASAFQAAAPRATAAGTCASTAPLVGRYASSGTSSSSLIPIPRSSARPIPASGHFGSGLAPSLLSRGLRVESMPFPQSCALELGDATLTAAPPPGAVFCTASIHTMHCVPGRAGWGGCFQCGQDESGPWPVRRPSLHRGTRSTYHGGRE